MFRDLNTTFTPFDSVILNSVKNVILVNKIHLEENIFKKLKYLPIGNEIMRGFFFFFFKISNPFSVTF